MVAKSEPLAQTMGVLNAVTIDGDAIGSLTLVGPGAGGDATASAVAADIADIARGIVDPVFGRPVAALVEAERAPMQRHEGGYYVRLAVVDRPGLDGGDRHAHGRAQHLARSDHAEAPAKDAPPSRVRAGGADHPRDDGSLDPRGAGLTVADGVVTGEAAGDPHREVVRAEGRGRRSEVAKRLP